MLPQEVPMLQDEAESHCEQQHKAETRSGDDNHHHHGQLANPMVFEWGLHVHLRIAILPPQARTTAFATDTPSSLVLLTCWPGSVESYLQRFSASIRFSRNLLLAARPLHMCRQPLRHQPLLVPLAALC